MIEVFGIIAFLVAVAGVVFNNKRMIACFYLWAVSNSIGLMLHWLAYKADAEGMIPMMCKDVVFLILLVPGWMNWKKKEN